MIYGTVLYGGRGEVAKWIQEVEEGKATQYV
jgi:hypothetical protein